MKRSASLIAIFTFCLSSLGAAQAADAPPRNGLVLWLDGADTSTLTLDAGGRITQWADKSGKGFNATVATAAAGVRPQPVANGINGRPTVRFSGGSGFLGKSIRATKGSVTLLMVSRRAADLAGGKAWQRVFSSRPLQTSNDNVAPNFTSAMSSAGAYDATLVIKEVSDSPIGPFGIGRNQVGVAENLRGEIAEVLVYDRPLSDQVERQAAFKYLADKWNVAIPAEADAWTRVGPLGTKPVQKFPKLPLSDQANAGNWQLDLKFSDEFSGSTLNTTRWHANPTAATDMLGRKPALFTPENVTVSNSALRIAFKKETVARMAKLSGYADYTSGLIRTNDRTGYGYYEIKAKVANAAASSAFWFSWTGIPNNLTEIDVFEIGGKTANGAYDKKYNMTAHVWSTPQSTTHWNTGSTWDANFRFAEYYHYYGFEWNADVLRWYVDGVLVREMKNTNWFFPMQMIFDSEAFINWFGPINNADLPATFAVDYVHVWRRGQ